MWRGTRGVGGPGADAPATRLFETLRLPHAVRAAISVLISELPPRPPGTPPPSLLAPIAIKSPTCRAAAKRTRQPPAPRKPGDARGDGPGPGALIGVRAHFLFRLPIRSTATGWTTPAPPRTPRGHNVARRSTHSSPSIPPHLTAPLSSPSSPTLPGFLRLQAALYPTSL